MPYYISRYIGAGTDNDPFVPRGSDQPGWSAIDLRPDGGATLSGGGLNACLLYLPVANPDVLLAAIGDDLTERIGVTKRAVVNTRLGVTLPADPTVSEVISFLMTTPPVNGWNPVRPTHLRRYEIWLNGLVWSSATISGGVDFTDTFDRGNNVDLGADWTPAATDVDRHCEILSNGAVPGAVGTGSSEAVTSISPGGNQNARVTIGTFTGAGDGALGSHIRVTVGAVRNWYIAYARKNAPGGKTTTMDKRVAGAGTLLIEESATTWAVADTLDFLGSGTSLTVLRNGSTILNTTDTAFSTGSIGITAFDASAVADSRIESFFGGDLVDPNPPMPRICM